MKIYIAGKITGLANYKELFDKTEEQLKSKGHICMNPAVMPEGFEWKDYMPICFAMIDACEAIYMLDNWEDSKGAKAEFSYAMSKSKKIIFNIESEE